MLIFSCPKWFVDKFSPRCIYIMRTTGALIWWWGNTLTKQIKNKRLLTVYLFFFSYFFILFLFSCMCAHSFSMWPWILPTIFCQVEPTTRIPRWAISCFFLHHAQIWIPKSVIFLSHSPRIWKLTPPMNGARRRWILHGGCMDHGVGNYTSI